MLKTLRNLILLSRMGMLPLSLSVPIIGALSLQQTPSFIDLLALAGIGISAHIFGFIVNDLMDVALDKQNPFRQRSPLVRGEVKIWQAWVFVLIQLPISYLLYVGVLNGQTGGLVWLGLSVSLSVIYNLFSKWRWLPRLLAEIALASSITLLGISGAWVYQQVLPTEVWLYCGTLGLILLSVNSVPSGLKDIQFDKMFGARSFVLSLGVEVSRDGILSLPRMLTVYLVVIQACILCFVVLLAIQYQVSLWIGLTIFLLQIFAGLHTIRILRLQQIDEFPSVILFLGGYYNYFALVSVLWIYFPSLLQIVIGLLIAYFLSLPFRRAWSIYRQRHKRILA